MKKKINLISLVFLIMLLIAPVCKANADTSINGHENCENKNNRHFWVDKEKDGKYYGIVFNTDGTADHYTYYEKSQLKNFPEECDFINHFFYLDVDCYYCSEDIGSFPDFKYSLNQDGDNVVLTIDKQEGGTTIETATKTFKFGTKHAYTGRSINFDVGNESICTKSENWDTMLNNVYKKSENLSNVTSGSKEAEKEVGKYSVEFSWSGDSGEDTKNLIFEYSICYLPSFTDESSEQSFTEEESLKCVDIGDNNSCILTFPECNFTAPEGKVFDGWKDDESGQVFHKGDILPIDDEITFVAVWKDGNQDPLPPEQQPEQQPESKPSTNNTNAVETKAEEVEESTPVVIKTYNSVESSDGWNKAYLIDSTGSHGNLGNHTNLVQPTIEMAGVKATGWKDIVNIIVEKGSSLTVNKVNESDNKNNNANIKIEEDSGLTIDNVIESDNKNANTTIKVESGTSITADRVNASDNKNINNYINVDEGGQLVVNKSNILSVKMGTATNVNNDMLNAFNNVGASEIALELNNNAVLFTPTDLAQKIEAKPNDETLYFDITCDKVGDFGKTVDELLPKSIVEFVGGDETSRVLMTKTNNDDMSNSGTLVIGTEKENAKSVSIYVADIANNTAYQYGTFDYTDGVAYLNTPITNQTVLLVENKVDANTMAQDKFLEFYKKSTSDNNLPFADELKLSGGLNTAVGVEINGNESDSTSTENDTQTTGNLSLVGVIESSEGWNTDGDNWSYIKDGQAVTGFTNEIPGWDTWFYFDENGVLVKGVKNIDGNTYYFDESSGALKTGWQIINGDWYYFDAVGKMLKNTTTPDGMYVGSDGKWVDNSTVSNLELKHL